MKKSRFTEEQIIGFLRQAEAGMPVKELCRQGAITKAGNIAARRMLVEVAWHYRVDPRVSPIIAARQDGLPEAVTQIAWQAQARLCSKFKRLSARRLMKTKAVVAVARELAGFVWAIGREVQRSGWAGIKPQA